MNCIQSLNPGAGFLNSHTAHCSRQHLDGEIEIKISATHHRNHGTHYCENLCEHCATTSDGRKRVLKSGVEVGVFVVDIS